jgi:hypothetical protein
MDLLFIIILAAISLVIGFMLSSLIFALRSMREEKPGVSPPAQAREGAVTIWREPGQEKLRVQVGEETIASGRALNSETKERLASLAADFQTWLGVDRERQSADLPDSSAFPQYETYPGSKTVTEQAWQSPVDSTPDWGTYFPDPIETLGEAASASPRGEAAEKSVVAKIDEILQVKLAGSPLAGLGIRLEEDLEQGIVVMVGLNQYADLEAVPDPHVRDIIQLAVSEWEKRTVS